MSVSLTNDESRQRWRELQAILLDWDPLGVVEFDCPPDEYDCLVGPLLCQLEAGAPTGDIRAYLSERLRDHFGLAFDQYDLSGIVHRVESWFARCWRNVGEPAVIYVALLGEAVDVWRPVKARSLPGGLFRIIGADGDVSEEVWEFAAGAVVRCEQKMFYGGKAGVTAVEQVQL
jgi:hypothetical protein